jgi:hypothetical protein
VAIDQGYSGSGGSGNGGPVQHAQRAFEEAKAFSSSLSDSASRFNEKLDLNGRVQRNPFGMVLAAAGIGYVLGGGLFSPLTGKLVRVGIRLALIPLVKSQIGGLAAGMMGGQGGASSGGTPQV